MVVGWSHRGCLPVGETAKKTVSRVTKCCGEDIFGMQILLGASPDEMLDVDPDLYLVIARHIFVCYNAALCRAVQIEVKSGGR